MRCGCGTYGLGETGEREWCLRPGRASRRRSEFEHLSGVIKISQLAACDTLIVCPLYFLIFKTPSPLSTFGTDQKHKIHATSFTSSAFGVPLFLKTSYKYRPLCSKYYLAAKRDVHCFLGMRTLVTQANRQLRMDARHALTPLIERDRFHNILQFLKIH